MLRTLANWVARNELPFTAALGAVFIFAGKYALIGLVIVGALWACRWYARRRATVHLPVLDASVGVLLLMLPVCLWASPNLELSWPPLWRIVWGVALFYSTINAVENATQLRSVICGLLVVAAGLSAVGLVGTEWIRTKLLDLPIYQFLPALVSNETRFPGGGFHPNVIAGTLAPFVPLALTASLCSAGLRRAAAGLLAVLLVFAVFLAQSRGAWLGLAAGLWTMAMVASRHWAWRVLLVLLVVAAVIAIWQVGLADAFLRVDATGSGVSRLEVWNRAVHMIRDTPFTGIGLGAFPAILDAFYPSFLGGPNAHIPHAHNLFLQIAVDLGLPGALAFTVLFGACLWMACQPLRCPASDRFVRGLSVGVVGALAVVAVHGLLDAPLWAARSSPLLWVLLALGPVLRRLTKAG